MCLPLLQNVLWEAQKSLDSVRGEKVAAEQLKQAADSKIKEMEVCTVVRV